MLLREFVRHHLGLPLRFSVGLYGHEIGPEVQIEQLVT